MPTSANQNPETVCAAIRLITKRGEGLVKLLGNTYPLSNPVKTTRLRWDFHLSQLFKSAEHSTTHNTMTSMNLLPRTGRMELIGNQSFAGCGLLYDLRLCDLKNEKFEFVEEAVGKNAWFYTLSKRAHDLRININLEELLDDKEIYNEIRAGVNAKAAVAVVLQPPVTREENYEDYYVNRFFAIQVKVNLANKIDRHLPIIILDAEKGPSEYTFKQQELDLKNYLKIHHNDEAVSNLNRLNTSLEAYAPVEFEIPGAASITAAQVNDHLILNKIKLVGEKIRLLHLLYFVNQQDPQLETLNDLFEENKIALADADESLKGFTPLMGNPLVTCLRHQENVAAQMQKLSQKTSTKLVERNFLQRYKKEILGALSIVVMVAAVATFSILTFGGADTLGILGVILAACAGGTAFGISALEITRLFHNNKPLIKSALEAPLKNLKEHPLLNKSHQTRDAHTKPEVLTPQNFFNLLTNAKNLDHKNLHHGHHHGIKPRGTK